MSQPRFKVLTSGDTPADLMTMMVIERATGRCLGAVGASFFRPWVFPLYTPSGLTVLQEFPYEHPWHNGIFVAQHPVNIGERSANFWAVPLMRDFNDHLMTRIGRQNVQGEPDIEVEDERVTFTFRSIWRDEHEEPVLDEVRTVRFRALPDATVVDVTSRKLAAYGALEFPQTKFGSVGVRAEPRLLPPLGGAILADGGRRGEETLVDAQPESDFLAYEGQWPGQGTFGVCMVLPNPELRGPWFACDWGMAVYNPTYFAGLQVPKDAEWTVFLRVIAYDGPLTPTRAAEWQGM